ncbi:hypothetical protein LZ554_004212 [Drepanopeziza brunnea f. sp. 'monogermtubi']|nr:hypothetical protein LZ554_004212 [Drepanopeziza brunnea f. sp. 'monogermtubi']
MCLGYHRLYAECGHQAPIIYSKCRANTTRNNSREPDDIRAGAPGSHEQCKVFFPPENQQRPAYLMKEGACESCRLKAERKQQKQRQILLQEELEKFKAEVWKKNNPRKWKMLNAVRKFLKPEISAPAED